MPAGRDDVLVTVWAAILACDEMLSSALDMHRLAPGDAMPGGEIVVVTLTHDDAAVVAASLLPVVGGHTQFLDAIYAGHERLL
jgi:hypothetical protein